MVTPPATSAAAARGAGTRQRGREIIKTVLSDYLCNFRSEAVCECASILTLKAATLVIIREHLWIYIPTKVRERGSDECKNLEKFPLFLL